MNYLRSIGGSVSSTWNSLNPATLSGAIDVIVVEQEDGSLACSPFHIRFGKFQLLRPYEKKVELTVNGEKRNFPMKVGEGGEAFFVFETQDSVPEALQTSPPVSPVSSPTLAASPPATPALQEPDPFDLEQASGLPPIRRVPPRAHGHGRSTTEGMPIPVPSLTRRAQSDAGELAALTATPPEPLTRRLSSGDFTTFADHAVPKLERQASDSVLPAAKAALDGRLEPGAGLLAAGPSHASPSLHQSAQQIEADRVETQKQDEARSRAMALSKKLWSSNISNQVTDSGDLMLDMAAYKSGNLEALQAEGIARQLLSEELEGPYDIGALIGADEKGNIWIYSSEEAKEAADKRAAAGIGNLLPTAYASTDALSDPGYHSDDAQSNGSKSDYTHNRRDSDSAVGLPSQPSSPGGVSGNPNKNYAKTLRLTSDQLKTMNLKSGANTMSFTVNRATCTATLWYWRHDVPIVISDIDGTITKSDVLGHVLNTLGRDWTHAGVAKLYTEIASNGYNFLYLTSRSVGQADTTRAYLKGVVQEGFRLPPGPVILSPDRTIAALRREVYLRKPEIFKMACLRDIMALFAGHGGANNVTETAVEAGLKPLPPGLGTGKGKSGSPFYAGFGNRLTDALSYRSVNIPSIRIFTINSNSEISLDLLSLNNYKTAYSTMREIVDHYFPPVGLLVKGGGEEFTDFNYWRDKPLDIGDFTDSEDEDAPIDAALTRLNKVDTRGEGSVLSEDEMGESIYATDAGRPSLDQSVAESFADEYEEQEGEDGDLRDSMLQSSEYYEDGEASGYEDEQGSEFEDDEAMEDDEDDEDGGIELEGRDDVGDAPRTPEMEGRKLAVDEARTPRIGATQDEEVVMEGGSNSPGRLSRVKEKVAGGLGFGEGWKK